jgi:hypothetical protein
MLYKNRYIFADLDWRVRPAQIYPRHIEHLPGFYRSNSSLKIVRPGADQNPIMIDIVVFPNRVKRVSSRPHIRVRKLSVPLGFEEPLYRLAFWFI